MEMQRKNPEADDVSLTVAQQQQQQQPERPKSGTGTFYKRQVAGGVASVNFNVKLLAAMTFFLTAVVVGMSIYVVHYKEFRAKVNGKNLVNDAGETIVTDQPTTVVSGVTNLLKMDSNVMKTLKEVEFFVAFPAGNAEVMMVVDKVVRFGSGSAHLYGSSGNDKVVVTPTTATYTDADMCKDPNPCKVILSLDDVKPDSSGRRLLSPRRDSKHVHGRQTWGSVKKAFTAVGSWFKATFGTDKKSTEPVDPPPAPQNHDYGETEFALKRVQNDNIVNVLKKCPETHHKVTKGIWWLDQFGSHAETDVGAVAAADTCFSFGMSEHYVLPEPETWTVDGEKHILRHRYDVEVFGRDAWLWVDEGGSDDDLENHSFNAASLLSLYYKFIWNDDYTFCRIAFTANLLGVEIEMPSFLASYWMKRGWKGVDDPQGLKWDRISYIGPIGLKNIFHYPVFKVYDYDDQSKDIKKTEHYDYYLHLANCKCGNSDGALGLETDAKKAFKQCYDQDPNAQNIASNTYKCTTSGMGYVKNGKAKKRGTQNFNIADFTKAGAVGL